MYGAAALPLIADQSWFSKTIRNTVLMWLSTVTCTGADAVALPCASTARTASVCAPFGTENESQVVTNGEAPTVASVAPSSWNTALAVPAGTVAVSATGPATELPAARPASEGAAGVST